MTQTFWIALIVAVAVVLVVLLLRRQLSSLFLKGMGMEARVETHGPDSQNAARNTRAMTKGGVNISGFKQSGSNNKLDIARGDVNLEQTQQKGSGQEINVRADQAEPKKP